MLNKTKTTMQIIVFFITIAFFVIPFSKISAQDANKQGYYLIFVLRQGHPNGSNSLCFIWDVATNRYAKIADPSGTGLLQYPAVWSNIESFVESNKVPYNGESGQEDAEHKQCYVQPVESYLNGRWSGYGRPRNEVIPEPIYIPDPDDINIGTTYSYDDRIYDPYDTNTICGISNDYRDFNLSTTYGVQGLGTNDLGLHRQIEDTHQVLNARRDNYSPSRYRRDSSRYAYVNTLNSYGEPVCMNIEEFNRFNQDYEYLPGDNLDGVANESLSNSVEIRIHTPLGVMEDIFELIGSANYSISILGDSFSYSISKEKSAIACNGGSPFSFAPSGYVKYYFPTTFNNSSLSCDLAGAQQFLWNEGNGYYKNLMYQVFFYADVKETIRCLE